MRLQTVEWMRWDSCHRATERMESQVARGDSEIDVDACLEAGRTVAVAAFLGMVRSAEERMASGAFDTAAVVAP